MKFINQRLDWLDAGRGASTVLVVVYHTLLWLNDLGISNPFYIQVDILFRPIRMPMFFAISGWLAASAMQMSWRDLFYRRLLIFIYLYGVWGVVTWFYYRFNQPNAHHIEFGTSILQLLTMWYKPESGLWFIWALAIYYIVARLVDGRRKEVVILISCLISMAFFTKKMSFFTFFQGNAFWYAPYFFAGLFYKTQIEKIVTSSPWATLASSGTIFFVCGAYFFYQQKFIANTGLIIGVTRFFLSSAGVMVGLSASFLVCRLEKPKRLLVYFGRNTLPIYLTNEILAAFLTTLLAQHVVPDGLVKYWSLPIISSIILFVALGFRVLAKYIGLEWLYGVPFIKQPTNRPHEQPNA